VGYIDKLLSQRHHSMSTFVNQDPPAIKNPPDVHNAFSVVYCRKIRQFVAHIAQKSGTVIRTKQHYTIN